MPPDSVRCLQGVLPVIQTPFAADDRIDAGTLQREIDWLFACGVNGVVMGMVSETTRLTDAERDELVENLVRGAKGRGPVIASVGGESAAQAVRHARAAESRGADAFMAIPPALTRCSNQEIAAYYRAIVGQTTRPLIVQDASGYLGNAIPLPVQAALWQEFPDRILFKPEAQPIGPGISALRSATQNRARIFDGMGGITLVGNFRRGIAGTMPGSDLAWAIVALWRALQDKDEKRVRAIQGPLTALIALQTNLDAFLAVEKMLLVEQGIFANARVRGPVGHVLDEETRQEILQLFTHLKTICGP